MTLTELQERIVQWENLHTEFKEWPVHPDALAASLVAFANTDGGQLILTESLYYDETPLLRLGVEDLDLDVVQHYLEETGRSNLGIETERLLQNSRLLSGRHPTSAGLLLFGREPQQHLPFAQINAARIPGIDIVHEPLDRKDCTGRLLEVISTAIRFIQLHLKVPHTIRGLEPEARPELPEEVFRYEQIASSH